MEENTMTGNFFNFGTKKDLSDKLLHQRENSYLGKDGIVYCKKCKMPLMFYMEEAKRWFPIRCSCEKENEEEQNHKAYVQNLKEHSGITGMFKGITFKDLSFCEQNDNIVTSCMKYAMNYDLIYKKGQGIYLYGDLETSRYYMSCLANEIMDKGREAVMIKLNDILYEMQNAMKERKDEREILKKYENVGLLILDNVGTEDYQKYGRETNYVQEVISELIESRYINKKPTCFVSMVNIADLYSKKGMNKETAMNINKMATRKFMVKAHPNIIGEDEEVLF